MSYPKILEVLMNIYDAGGIFTEEEGPFSSNSSFRLFPKSLRKGKSVGIAVQAMLQ